MGQHSGIPYPESATTMTNSDASSINVTHQAQIRCPKPQDGVIDEIAKHRRNIFDLHYLPSTKVSSRIFTVTPRSEARAI